MRRPRAGYRVDASTEVTDVKDGAPYRAGADWMVERTTTLLPLCNYFSPVGSYSLKSYSLDPFTEDRARDAVPCRTRSRPTPAHARRSDDGTAAPPLPSLSTRGRGEESKLW